MPMKKINKYIFKEEGMSHSVAQADLALAVILLPQPSSAVNTMYELLSLV